MTIEWIETQIKLKDLKDFDRNPRYISKEQYQLLVKSLKENGYHNRILADHNNRIIGGHQRKKALKEIGLKPNDLIKVLKPDQEISEEKFKEMNLTDNFSYGNWNIEQLANDWEIDELIDLGFDKNLLKDLFEEEEEEKINDLNKKAIEDDNRNLLLIELETEEELEQLYNEMIERGLTCKIMN